MDDGSADPDGWAAFAELGVELETFPLPRQLFPRWSGGWWRAKAGGLRNPSYFYYQPALQERLGALCRLGQADVVLLETLKMCAYGLNLKFPNVIFSRQNYEPELARRIADILPLSQEKLLWRIGEWLCESAERRICRRFRFITAVSDREAEVFRRLAPEAEVVVVPNGADLERFASSEGDGGGIVLPGLMSYLPNRDSALYFHREIWPHVRRECPDARFVVVGRHALRALPELTGAPGVELREPGKEIVPALGSATVIVVPLRAGAGTRIKVLEALALGKPVVSTSVGCEGLEVVNGRDLLIADRPQEFARFLVRLLRDPERRRELGTNGRKLVESRYGWERSAEILETFCTRVVDLSRTRTGRR